MIAGVRQFKLINALGREYDMTRPDALLHAPDGLGWGTERTVNRLGMTYIGINEKEIHQSPSGEMVFRTYEEYGRFLSFCQQGGLVLCYKPIDTWYYCECLISIQKSEIQWENNHLICPVQFTLLSYWYEKVVAQTAEPPEPVEPNYETVTGDPAFFTARYSYPIKDLSVAIQGTQELNGYDKPWVGGAGKNLLNTSQLFDGGSYNSAIGTVWTLTPSARTLTDNGDGTFTLDLQESGWKYVTMLAKVSASTDYWVHFQRQAPHIRHTVGFLSSSYEVLSVTNNSLTDYTINLKYTSPSNRAYFYIVMTNAGWTDTLVTITDPMVEKGSTATAYEPYENICPIISYDSVTITQTGSQTNTYTVELIGAGNVYKGTLDVTSGELVVNWIERVFDGTEAWTLYTGTTTFYTNTINPLGKSNIETYCSHYYYSSRGTVPKYAHRLAGGTSGTNRLYIDDERYATARLFQQYLARQYANGTPVTFAYPLQTPLTYQLTPTQMSNLIGSNTIQADAGAVTVTYRTDARTEYKIYPYQYSYRYGDTAQNVFDISCDLPSYFKLTIFGERTNPSWRVVQNGSIVKSGKLNATIGSSQKLVINTDPKQTEIALYTLSNTRINNLYGYSDFATERIFALPQGESQVQVLTEDEQSPKVMIEVLKHV